MGSVGWKHTGPYVTPCRAENDAMAVSVVTDDAAVDVETDSSVLLSVDARTS